MKPVSILRLLALVCALLTLTACGGGGGGGGSASTNNSSQDKSIGVASDSYTLSGVVSLPSTAAVDSDTNDPAQSGWTSNNTVATAQAVTTPIDLLGSLNLATTGPAGMTYQSGDPLDIFQLSLSAGQVIELVFVGDVSTTDVDLTLYNSSQAIVGTSASTNNNRECIYVSNSGDYYLAASISKGAALYSLHIGSAGESTSCSNSSTSAEMFVPGQLITKARTASTSVLSSISSMFSGASATAGKPELLEIPASAMRPEAGGIRRQTIDTRDDAIWRSLGTLRHAKALQAAGDYEYAEPNYRRQKMATFAPNDPSYSTLQNWNYQQINLPSAMSSILALNPPSQLPIVAVIDDGIVSDHPDLAGQIAGGYSFITVTSNGDGNTASPDDPSTSANAPEWHGTHVAGTIAAIRDNGQFGIGVASVAKLMPLRVFRPGYSYATDYDIIQAIRYASGLSNNSGTYPARKADVINMSLGASGTCTSAYTDVISQARAQNVIVVAAAGNSATGTQAITVPANCTGVISVGATGASKTRAYYSNQGSKLSLVAPGGGSATTSDYIYSTLGSFNASGTRIASFGKMAGTSMATPHVAGVMALMRYADPALTPAQVDSLLVSSKLTDDIGNTGRDNATGYGVINAYKAVTEAIALAASSSTPTGVIIASPASLDFGSTLTSATLTLSATASTSETVKSISASSSAVSVVASSVNSAGLGTYTVSVNRSGLAVGTTNPTLTITTSAQVISVPVSITKVAASSSTTTSYGGVWVKITDASTGTILASKRFNPSAGSYAWSLTGIPAGNVYLTASTDLDNDSVLCESGEACGGYAGNSQSIQVSSSLSGLNFSIAPTLGTSTAGTRLSP